MNWSVAEHLKDTPGANKLLHRGNEKQRKKPIVVNDASLEIYESFHTVLLSLRSPHSAEGRVLWVDAICINQEDVAERNEQVPMMDRIYQNAWRTIVWLGPETQEGPESFSMLHDLAQDARALRNTSSGSSFGKDSAAEDIDS